MKKYNVQNNNFKEFLIKHEKDSPKNLLLKYSDKSLDFSVDLAVTQLECRQKAYKKLSWFICNEDFLFPCKQVCEQSTHQVVAAYHSSILDNNLNIIDMTGGLGIDSFMLANHSQKVTTVELDSDRAAALKYNAQILGLHNLDVVNADSIKYISSNADNCRYDVMFIDPARRDGLNNKKFLFEDCLPNIVDNFDIILSSADLVLIKASPMVDLTYVINRLNHIRRIDIICVKGECKEVLIFAGLNPQRMHLKSLVHNEIDLNVLNLNEQMGDSNYMSFEILNKFSTTNRQLGNSNSPIIELDDIKIPDNYFLYDPNAGISKLNISEELCRRFTHLKKLSKNTNLYISNQFFKDFPGRIFKLVNIITKKNIKSLIGEPIEVNSRNYPLSSEELKKSLKVKTGVNPKFIFACKIGAKEKPVLLQAVKL